MKIDPEILARLKLAFKTYESDETYEKIVLDLKAKGVGQREVYNIFSEFLKFVMKNGTEEQDDALRNVMDRIVGWGNTKFWLFDDYLKT